MLLLLLLFLCFGQTKNEKGKKGEKIVKGCDDISYEQGNQDGGKTDSYLGTAAQLGYCYSGVFRRIHSPSFLQLVFCSHGDVINSMSDQIVI